MDQNLVLESVRSSGSAVLDRIRTALVLVGLDQISALQRFGLSRVRTVSAETTAGLGPTGSDLVLTWF